MLQPSPSEMLPPGALLLQRFLTYASYGPPAPSRALDPGIGLQQCLWGDPKSTLPLSRSFQSPCFVTLEEGPMHYIKVAPKIV
jgi:hypothetical protein